MSLTQAYDKILDFLAAGTTAESIANFRPSDEAVARVRELIERRSEDKISPAESEELEEYLQLENLNDSGEGEGAASPLNGEEHGQTARPPVARSTRPWPVRRRGPTPR